MDFGRLLADPIMRIPVVNSLFFSSRGHGRFSLHSLRRKFESCVFKHCCFLVWGLAFEGLLDRRGHHFGSQKTSKKNECPKKPKTAKREKRIANLRNPVGSARKRLRIANVFSTRMALLKNVRAGGIGFKFRSKKHNLFDAKNR